MSAPAAIRELDDGQGDDGRISLNAIVAVVLAIPSLLAMVHPAGALIAIIAAIVAAVSLVSIARSDNMLKGRNLARAALAVATFAAAFGVVHFATRINRIYGEARNVCEEWLNQIRDGEIDEAYQARVRPEERKPFKMSFDEYYKKFEQHSFRIQQFTERTPFRELVRYGRKGELRFVRNVGMQQYGEDQHITQKYSFSYEESGRRLTLPITIVIVRQYYHGMNNCMWELKSAELDVE